MAGTATAPTDPADRRQPGLLLLWSGMLGPPILWAIRISASYVLVPMVCRTGWIGILHALTAASLVGVLVFGVLAYRAWRGRHGTDTPPTGRIRFMGLTGVLSASFFFAVIVAEGLANFLVHPCLGAGAPL